MHNMYQKNRHKVKEAMREHRFLREIKRICNQPAGGAKGLDHLGWKNPEERGGSQ